MSYNTAIPQITDKTLQSSQQLLANFQAIYAAWANNHTLLNGDSTYFGMHNVLVLRPQNSDPTTAATQTAVYNKLVSGTPAIFYAPSSAQTPIQLTYPSVNTGDALTAQYSFVAGPFVVYGGYLPAVTRNQLVTLSPVTTLLYVNLTVGGDINMPTFNKMAIPVSVSGNTFRIQFTPQGIPTPKVNIYYFAIGQ